MHKVTKDLVTVAVGCEFLKLTNEVRLADDYGQRICHGANLSKRWCMAGLPSVPMHGVRNAPLLPIRGLTIGDREGRTDYGKWWKCQVEIKNAPKGVFYLLLEVKYYLKETVALLIATLPK